MARVEGGLAQLLGALAGLASETTAPRLVGVGWATVDIERTAESLPGVELRSADADELLGARSWRTTSGPVALLLLEPATEGRLAAALARHGEGIVALYLAADGPLAGALRPTSLGVPGRLMPDTRPSGPFIILVDTIVPTPSVPDPSVPDSSVPTPSVPGGSSMPGRVDRPP